jgi:hypothetical protein
MLPSLFQRVRQYIDTPEEMQQARARLAFAPVTAAMCNAFAERMQNADAASLARRAALRPNAERLPMLAIAMRDERANPVSEKPTVRKPAPRAIISRKDACESLKNAARQFPVDVRISPLFLAIKNMAEAHKLTMPKPDPRESAESACPFDVHDAVIDLAYAPTKENLADAVSTLHRYGKAIMAQHDALPERLLRKNVKAPEPNAPIVHRIPEGALDWATQPVIGADPLSVALENEEFGRKRAMERRIEKRAARIKGAPQPKKRAARAEKVRNIMWHARMGKEVLTLKR